MCVCVCVCVCTCVSADSRVCVFVCVNRAHSLLTTIYDDGVVVTAGNHRFAVKRIIYAVNLLFVLSENLGNFKGTKNVRCELHDRFLSYLHQPYILNTR